MDYISHGLASFALTRAVFPRVARPTIFGAIVAGMIADVDNLSASFGPSAYLKWHRTFSHSFVLALLIAVLVSFAVWTVSHRKPSKDSVTIVFSVGLAASLLHLAMDFFQNEGLELLWPFRSQRYSTEWVASFDLWILAALFAGALLPRLFGLVTEEIGAKSKAPRGQIGAALALAGVALYIGGRGALHGNAIALLESRTYRGELPRKVGALAESDSPLHWRGVVETERALHDLDVQIAPGAPFNPDAAVVFYKPETSPALEAARNSDVVREFLQAAKFPKASVEKTNTGFRVEVRGFPYRREARSQRRIIAVVETDATGKAVNEEFKWE